MEEFQENGEGWMEEEQVLSDTSIVSSQNDHLLVTLPVKGGWGE